MPAEAIIDIEDLDLNPAEAESMSEVIFEQKLAKGEFNKIHAVITGIQSGRKIPFVGKLGIVGECIDGCNIPTGAGLSMSEKTWDPKTVGFRLTNCSKDLNNLMTLLKKKIQTYVDQYDFTGSNEEAVVLMRTEEAIDDMLWRVAHFGDKNIANVEDNGILNDDYAVKYFNCIDGLWAKIFAMYGPALSGGARYVEIVENQEATEEAQLQLDPARAIGVFKSLLKKAPSPLKGAKNKMILATRSLIENWLDYLEDKSLANTTDAKNLLATQSADDGNTFLVGVYRGCKIYCVDYWDTAISTYFNNGVKLDKPHRAILTTPDNIPIGTPSTKMLGDMSSWYSKDDKVNYIEAEIMLDVQVLEHTMAVVAF